MKPLADIIREASALSGLDPLERTRKSAVVHVRAAIALAAEKAGYKQGEIGKTLRLDRTTVIHLLSMSGRPAVQNLLHRLDPPSAIELDTTFDGGAVKEIILHYMHGHNKEKPSSAKGIRRTTKSYSKTGYRPLSKSNSHFMTGEELRSYALDELGMSEEEFREARAHTRVYPTYPSRHQTGAG